jgi:hypothetical protein
MITLHFAIATKWNKLLRDINPIWQNGKNKEVLNINSIVIGYG